MIKEILTNLYRIEVPLPHNPLKAINSYIVKAEQRSLVVDTGMNREECLNVITSDLGALDIDITRACFFITHMHVDHSGLISNLATNKSTVYASQADASVIKFIDARFWENESAFYRPMRRVPEAIS